MGRVLFSLVSLDTGFCAVRARVPLCVWATTGLEQILGLGGSHNMS